MIYVTDNKIDLKEINLDSVLLDIETITSEEVKNILKEYLWEGYPTNIETGWKLSNVLEEVGDEETGEIDEADEAEETESEEEYKEMRLNRYFIRMLGNYTRREFPLRRLGKRDVILLASISDGYNNLITWKKIELK